MAATKGSTGKGLIFAIGSGSPETFTPILQVKTYSHSGASAKYDDVTNAGSPTLGGVAGAPIIEEALPTTVSPGTYKVSGVFLPSDTGYQALATAFSTQALTDFKVTMPLFSGQTTAASITFSGFVQDWPYGLDVDYSKTINYSITIKLNTFPVLTAGS